MPLFNISVCFSNLFYWIGPVNYWFELVRFNKLLEKNPADLEAHLLLGQLHLAKGETSAAIGEFNTVLKQEPKSAPARYQLAQAQLQSGNIQQAKTELREAITIAPTGLTLSAPNKPQSVGGAVRPASTC